MGGAFMRTDILTVEIEEIDYAADDCTIASNDCGACGSCGPD